MVDLEDFVRDAIVGIVKGMKSADSSLDHAAIIAPRVVKVTRNYQGDPSKPNEATLKKGESINEGGLQIIEFDVAVTVSEGTEVKASGEGKVSAESKGLIKVVAADIQGSATLARERTTHQKDDRVSRVKFSVPIHYIGKELPLYQDTHATPPASSTLPLA